MPYKQKASLVHIQGAVCIILGRGDQEDADQLQRDGRGTTIQACLMEENIACKGAIQGGEKIAG